MQPPCPTRRYLQAWRGIEVRDERPLDRFPFAQPIVANQLLSDLDEPLGRITTLERDPDSIEASFQPVVVEARGEKAPIDNAEHLVDAVAKDEASVLHRDARLGAWDKAAVHVDDVFRFHFMPVEGEGRWLARDQDVLTPLTVY